MSDQGVCETSIRASAKNRIRRVIKAQGLSAYFRTHISPIHGDSVAPYILAHAIEGRGWTGTHRIGNFDEIAQMSDTALTQLIHRKFGMHKSQERLKNDIQQ